MSGLATAERRRFIGEMPKVELHVHLEGTLEADMKFALAQRNGLALPYADGDALRRSYVFQDLASFLAIYYEGNSVLLKERDFYDLCYAYLERAASQQIVYSEMFFDPQQHMSRGVAIGDVIGGIARAQADARAQLGIESGLILCFMRELSEASALAALEAALPFRRHLIGVGLDSDERGHPPGKFAAVFAWARTLGLRVTAHCDIDQPDTHAHIWQALSELRVDRIDHGGNVLERPELVSLARERAVAFTVCPSYSGMLLGDDGGPIDVVRGMIAAGLKVTISTDDPAYMGGEYLSEVLIRAAARSGLSDDELLLVQRNAIKAAWISPAQCDGFLARLEAFSTDWQARSSAGAA